MRLVSLYTSVNGRISRMTWWLGAVGLTAAYLALRYPLQFILEIEEQDVGVGGQTLLFPSITDDSFLAYRLANLALGILCGFLGYCLSVKRRHDRGAAGWEVAILFAYPAILAVIGVGLMAFHNASEAGGPDGFQLALFLVTNYIYYPFIIYTVVVLGLLKGARGANRYGVDPLATSVQPAGAQ